MPRTKRLPKQYRIRRDEEGVFCRVNATYHSAPLKHIVFHSPDGFEISYAGSGPADLALSILADWLEESNDDVMAFVYGNEKKKIRSFGLHQKFKEDFIASMPKLKIDGSITIRSEEIEKWLENEEQ